MPKIFRDITVIQLSQLLSYYGYKESRQTERHIRLTCKTMGYEHHITILNHNPLKVGTLNNIINDIAQYLTSEKSIILKELFK